jgi:hypothetical protein
VIESGLYQLLASDSAVSAMVAASPGQARIYGVMLPKDYVLPAVVYSTVAYRPIESLRGPNVLEMRRFQFDCYARSFASSRLLSRAVRNVLCPPDANGDPTSLKVELQDGSGIDATQIIVDMDKPYEEGEGGYVFCALLDVEIAFRNAD